MFTVIVFALLAGLLVVAGLTAITRNRRAMEDGGPRPSRRDRENRKAQRAQSKRNRRKRH